MSLFFALVYLAVEYLRPQSMYETLMGLPLAKIAVLCVAVAFILEGRKPSTSSFQNYLILAYLSWFSICSYNAFNPEIAWEAFIDFSKWVVVYFLLINVADDRKKLYILVIVFLLLNFKYAQFAVRTWAERGFYSDPRGFHEGGGIGSSFFRNPNDFGVALNSVFGLSFYMIFSDMKRIFFWFRMRWVHVFSTPVIALAVLASSSRGAALALAAVALGILYKSKRKIIGTAVLAAVAIAFISMIPEDNWSRFQLIGDEADNTSHSRLALWRSGMQMAADHPLTGVGPNNFVYANQSVYDPELRVVQHNIFVQAVSELGYPGLILFISMVLGCFYSHRRTRKILKEKNIDDPFLYGLSHGLDIALLGFLANGLFITVLYYPFFWMILILSVSLQSAAQRLECLTPQSPEAREQPS